MVTFWLDRDTDDVTGGQSFHDFLAWAEEQDPLVEMPRDLHLAPRLWRFDGVSCGFLRFRGGFS